MADREAYVKKLKAQLDQWGAEISKLEAKAEKARADSKIQYEKQINELREQRREAQKKMTEIQEAQEDAWEDLREGADKAWKAMEDAFKKAWSKFK